MSRLQPMRRAVGDVPVSTIVPAWNGERATSWMLGAVMVAAVGMASSAAGRPPISGGSPRGTLQARRSRPVLELRSTMAAGNRDAPGRTTNERAGHQNQRLFF